MNDSLDPPKGAGWAARALGSEIRQLRIGCEDRDVTPPIILTVLGGASNTIWDTSVPYRC
jgi:hypothetical protein